jgi:hypothetical protein
MIFSGLPLGPLRANGRSTGGTATGNTAAGVSSKAGSERVLSYDLVLMNRLIQKLGPWRYGGC